MPAAAARGDREAGQALPVYLTVVAGLLFLAFAFFVVAQVAVARNGAQSAADAAALAAARDARDQLRTQLVNQLSTPTGWPALIQGTGYVDPGACQAARSFATRNHSDALAGDEGCHPIAGPRIGFGVKVRSQKGVSSDLLPVKDQHTEAKATAVVQPRCALLPPLPAADGHLHLTCSGGRTWNIDPRAPVIPASLPTADDLYAVRLTG
ncbi:pilus assembly protein TadG-related protein [Streptomyces orinoci]|uniref:Pilus assembly protein TadG-related protein n=1 Tax=Streptomyces orinoci TaxID=67339 RepID=A0ABV3JSF0_STRON|nr:pilus assembly protein TadG-related protein [Streptomyces orinoci]